MKYEMIDCIECGGNDYKGVSPFNCGYPACNKNTEECNTTGKIKSDYIIIDDPVEAVLFLGKDVLFINPDNKIWVANFYIISEDGFEDESFNSADKIKVHKSIVKGICEDKPLAIIILSYGMTKEEYKEFRLWSTGEKEDEL